MADLLIAILIALVSHWPDEHRFAVADWIEAQGYSWRDAQAAVPSCEWTEDYRVDC